MSKPYTISINNGTGSSEIVVGEYTVTSNAVGYNNDSIDPASLTITDSELTYNLTIAATGTLTLHVTDDGTEAGTPIVGAKFIRCDSEGNTYGEEIVSDDSGNAIFNYVPYSVDGDAPLVYYKQTESDGEHDFAKDLLNSQLSEETVTVEIFNSPPLSKVVNLTDANYTGLPIESAEITLS